jgi:hypothetical protein
MKDNNSLDIETIAIAHGLMYPPGTRVELVSDSDLCDDGLKPGDKGTVRFVNTIGMVHIAWDRGINRVAIWGADKIRRVGKL